MGLGGVRLADAVEHNGALESFGTKVFDHLDDPTGKWSLDPDGFEYFANALRNNVCIQYVSVGDGPQQSASFTTPCHALSDSGPSTEDAEPQRAAGASDADPLGDTERSSKPSRLRHLHFENAFVMQKDSEVHGCNCYYV